MRAGSFNEETIEMPIWDRGASRTNLPSGAHVRLDALGCCADPVSEGDQILTDDGRRYEVKAIKEVWLLDSFVRRDCDLIKLPLFEAPPSSVSSVKDRASDARSNTKSYIDLKTRSSQITKNDDSTLASWACIYENPPYSLQREFRAASNPVQGLYVVCQPNSSPLIEVGRTVFGYEEHVPIRICAIDSTDVTGTVLQWKMEAELRYVCENHPSGSWRLPERFTPHDRLLGSLWLYDKEFVLDYTRVK